MKNKILVIDDEFLIRYTLAEGLKDRGYETESAGSVEEGLEKMKTFGPEVILLDNLLENSRGMDEIPAFRKLDENVQVIMMTAYGSVSQAVEAIKQGAYDYVLKPFDICTLEEKSSYAAATIPSIYLTNGISSFVSSCQLCELSCKAS